MTKTERRVKDQIAWVRANRGPFPAQDPLRAFRILAEEVLEVCREVGPGCYAPRLYDELIQVAAVATIWATKIEGEGNVKANRSDNSDSGRAVRVGVEGDGGGTVGEGPSNP